MTRIPTVSSSPQIILAQSVCHLLLKAISHTTAGIHMLSPGVNDGV